MGIKGTPHKITRYRITLLCQDPACTRPNKEFDHFVIHSTFKEKRYCPQCIERRIRDRNRETARKLRQKKQGVFDL